jgi:hypothetical protein
MASGLCAALTGRTHGCTDQPANVKKTLANSEPSTHGIKRHADCADECPHSEVKRTWPKDGVMSAYDPERKLNAPRSGVVTPASPR